MRQARRAERGLAFVLRLPTLPVKNGAPPHDIGDSRHTKVIRSPDGGKKALKGGRILQCGLPESHRETIPSRQKGVGSHK
ncbi:hypothetical protein EEL39_11190 [Muribaculaceae bacterium Isolate-080 (Janvier)]|nr:hypothetical protein EEL39_11190 [Muribaculaceae bacterium Isolate-080 (Janvier)]